MSFEYCPHRACLGGESDWSYPDGDDHQPLPPSPIISLRGISKSFGGVRALRDVGFDVAKGEVHAVVGENGAGKSTLMKILAGVYHRDTGEVLINGEPARLRDRHDALDAGVAIVYQEPSLCPNLSIAENVFLGHEAPGWLPGTVSFRDAERRTAELLDRVHLPLDPATPVRRLTVAQRHLVQVARCLAFDTPILIMDEPSASLSDRETQTLFSIIRRLQRERVTILYISHKLSEIFEIADRVTVLRDGEFVATLDVSETTHDKIVRAMVGRDVAAVDRVAAPADAAPVLQVQGLSRPGAFRNVDLSVLRGEVVTLAGLVGSGRTEVARALFGLDRPASGSVVFDGRPRRFRSPAQAVAAGIGMVPEDRGLQGLILDMAVDRNVALPRVACRMGDSDDVTAAGGLVRPGRVRGLARRFVDKLDIRLSRLAAPAHSLSGGNQQKVVLAKWLSIRPKLLILDEPTRGIDVAAKAQIHGLVRQMARDGLAVLMISSDLPEVLTLSDRIYVMHEGAVTGELAGAAATEEKVMALATRADSLRCIDSLPREPA